SSFTTASCPRSAAHDNGVCPRLSLDSSLAPLSRSSFATVPCPHSAARDNGVCPRLSLDSSSAPLLRSSFATAPCPHPAAQDSGVRPSLSFESTSTSTLCKFPKIANEELIKLYLDRTCNRVVPSGGQFFEYPPIN